MLAKWQRDLNLRKRKNRNPEKKRQAGRSRYDDKKESVKQYIEEKYVENQTPDFVYTKYKKDPALQIEYSKNTRNTKKISKNEVSEFTATCKTRTLLYLHNIPSKLVSG